MAQPPLIVDVSTNARAVYQIDPTTGQPLVVAAGGDASAANQATQITAAQLTNTTLGAVTASPAANTIGDRLKAINTALGTPLQAGGTVSSIGSRPLVLKGGPVPNTTSLYAITTGIGGVIAIPTGLAPGTVILTAIIRMKCLLANITTKGTVEFHFFDANPTGSTFGDNATISLVAADLQKLISLFGTAWTDGAAGTISQISTNLPRITVDGSGNIYIALSATGAVLFAAANTLYWEIDGVY